MIHNLIGSYLGQIYLFSDKTDQPDTENKDKDTTESDTDKDKSQLAEKDKKIEGTADSSVALLTQLPFLRDKNTLDYKTSVSSIGPNQQNVIIFLPVRVNIRFGLSFYPPTRKGSGDIAISLASVRLSVCPSVRPSVRP